MAKLNWRNPTVALLTSALCIGSLMYASWNMGNWQAERIAGRKQSSADHVVYAQDRIAENCSSLEAGLIAECVAQEIQAAQDFSRAESDLDAQQAMAFWAKLMTLAGIVGSVVTAFGLYFVWRTLHVTSEAAAAAVASNEIMRNDQRPWLKFEHSTSFESNELNFRISFRNVGNRPAFNIRFAQVRSNDSDHPLETVKEDTLKAYNLAKDSFSIGGVVFPNDIPGLNLKENIKLPKNQSTAMASFACAVIYDASSDVVQKSTVGYFTISVITKDNRTNFREVSSIGDLIIDVYQSFGVTT